MLVDDVKASNAPDTMITKGAANTTKATAQSAKRITFDGRRPGFQPSALSNWPSFPRRDAPVGRSRMLIGPSPCGMTGRGRPR